MSVKAILSNPTSVMAMGHKLASHRLSLKKFQVTTLAVLLLAGSSLAHAHGNHDLSVSSPTSVEATLLTPTLASNALLNKAAQGRQPFMNSHGQIQAHALIEHWQNIGLTPQQAQSLVDVIMVAQIPTITRDARTLAHAEQLSTLTQGALEVTNTYQAESFLRHYHPISMSAKKLITQSESLNTADMVQNWAQVHTYWDSLNQQFDRPHPVSEAAQETPSPLELRRAQQNVYQSMVTSGLVTLKIPFAAWGNPRELNQLAERIVEANQQLQHVTQMDGPVLGMNGKVALRLGTSDNSNFAYRTQTDIVEIRTTWENLAHEWFHAFQATVLPQWSYGQTLASENPHHNAWNQLVPNLLNHSSTWNQERALYFSQLKGTEREGYSHYLGNDGETSAYAFASYVQQKIGQKGILGDSNPIHPVYDNQVGPSLKEAAKAAPVWQNLMTQTQQTLEWAKPLSVKPKMTAQLTHK